MFRFFRLFGVAAVMVCAAVSGLLAQSAPSVPRMIDVDGRAMRVWTSGLDERRAGQPVVILESGAGEGLDTWKPVFAEIARVTPVIAYDRRGLGQSAPDSEKPTLRRVAQSLHAVLQRLSVSPPYVLVGHSWGGLFARAFFDQYSPEVAGLMFLEATNPGMTREERAKGLPPAEREKALAPPTLPQMPADTPPGLRAENEVVGSEMVNDYPEARSLRSPAGVPIVVVSARPPGRRASMVSFDQAELALRSPKGMFVAASHVGHLVHRDDPALVVRLIEHVLKYAAPPPPPK